MYETYDITTLTLFVMSVVAAPWSVGSAVNMFRSGRRNRGALIAVLALLWIALAVYLVIKLSSLSFLKPVQDLPFLWNLISNNL